MLGQVITFSMPGPSPRVRGIPRAAQLLKKVMGSIPACAGNPSSTSETLPSSWVHPRVCGESTAGEGAAGLAQGPSPRVRGIPAAANEGGDRPGSIPACAGNPSMRASAISRRTVHPRVCGESGTHSTRPLLLMGPSPRVRGIRAAAGAAAGGRGSIPACAGNPPRFQAQSDSTRVHPRVCGESDQVSGTGSSRRGPSPRVRGIRRRLPPAEGRHGSIPACAGNPVADAVCTRRRGVHPRVCGESSALPEMSVAGAGPSPRVRGIRRLPLLTGRLEGSIPACAGNPAHRSRHPRRSGVHPRVCGESLDKAGLLALVEGPSPRVRGILCQVIDSGRLDSVVQRAAT